MLYNKGMLKFCWLNPLGLPLHVGDSCGGLRSFIFVFYIIVNEYRQFSINYHVQNVECLPKIATAVRTHWKYLSI